MDTISIIQDFIHDKVMLGGNRQAIEPDKDLITSGMLDSLAIMQLILYVEERFGVAVADTELVPNNFRTMNLIKEFIERKQQLMQPVAK